MERVEALPRWPSGPAKIAAMRRQATPADEGATLGDRRHQVGGGCLTSPGQLGGRRAGWHGRVGGLADCRRAATRSRPQNAPTGWDGCVELHERRFQDCRAAEAAGPPWSYMTLWQFQFWTTRGKMKFRRTLRRSRELVNRWVRNREGTTTGAMSARRGQGPLRQF